MRPTHTLLSAQTAADLDLAAAGQGVTGRNLMAAAARSVTRAITHAFAPCKVCIVCGPGNNGGDGLLVAHKLKRAGWIVQVTSQPAWRRRQGDAAWAQAVAVEDECDLATAIDLGFELLVDAAFGAGLNRPLDPELVDLFAHSQSKSIPVVAIDMASGVSGTSGRADPGTIPATLTATFVRPKIGHTLLPGRLFGGDIQISDIGISDRLVAASQPRVELNTPALWAQNLPTKLATGSKYDAGHAVVLGGMAGRTGAASMTAMAADQIGAGLVTLGCAPTDMASYEPRFLEIMLHAIEETDTLADWLTDRRITALAVGPAFGLSAERAAWLEVCLASGKPIVVDADGITLLAQNPHLMTLLHRDVVLTPHDGEFSRISQAAESRLERARTAARELQVVMVLKGGDTVVATPDGSATIATHAPPDLAKAGSGDILCGIITGLIAQGMQPQQAASAGVWLHGEAGRSSPGLIASQIVMDDTIQKALERARRFTIAEHYFCS